MLKNRSFGVAVVSVVNANVWDPGVEAANGL